jgi:hypothetical protein
VIADVVRCFDKERQRMSEPRLAGPRLPNQTNLTRHFLEQRTFTLHESKFLATKSGKLRGIYGRRSWILGERSQYGACELEATSLVRSLQSAQCTEALCITFKVKEVGPFLSTQLPFGEPLVRLWRGCKPVLDGGFARVAKWRIANVMGKACCGDDVPNVVRRPIACNAPSPLTMAPAAMIPSERPTEATSKLCVSRVRT